MSSFTKNNALTLATTGSAVLDFFSRAAACRSIVQTADGVQKVANLFDSAFKENPTLATRALFYTRDVRGGQGERGVFRSVIANLANKNPGLVTGNFNAIVEMGRWDDIVSLLLTNCEKDAAAFMYRQLLNDIENDRKDQPISLLAKWLPSANASSQNTRLLARRFIQLTGIKNEREYRKMLVPLRKRLDLVERNLCAKQLQAINYETIPAGSGMKYRKAFLAKDGERYRAHIEGVINGVKTVKAATLYPYDIIAPLFRSGGMHHKGDKYYVTLDNVTSQDETVMEAYWASLPNYFEGQHNALAVVDTSGSMRGLPIKVAVSLGLYCATKSTGFFAGKFLTFSDKPTLETLKGNNIAQKAANMSQSSWGSNTDLQAVFDVILSAALKYKVDQAKMPSKIFIVSDMQFDAAVASNDRTNFEIIKAKYETAGYNMPELIFWNVNGISDSPVSKDERGVMLVAGCSPSILKSALSGKITSPYEKMLDVLNAKRYDSIYVNA